MTPAPRIAVVGSCNMDISAYVERAPEQGETLSGISSKTSPGGKGANQAIAAARLGGDVSFIGAVGDDGYGRALRTAFERAGVDTSCLRTVQEETGIAVILVERSGANRIVVVPGANATLCSLTSADEQLIAAADLLLLQLESPLEVVIAAARVAHAAGTRVVLTPAPARRLPDELTEQVDILVPNEHESLHVAEADVPGDALATLAARVPDVVVTLGERGGVHIGRDGARLFFATPPVEAVDTTAAGDTFVGALALALGQARAWPDALEWAAAAAAVSVGRAGASESMPTRDEVELLLAGR